MAKSVRVGKIDLDTCGATFLLGISREEKVVVVRGEAASSDLNDGEVICIEVGGSGQMALNNWDHHAEDGPKHSATSQVGYCLAKPECFCGAFHWGIVEEEDLRNTCEAKWVSGGSYEVASLIGYINLLDTKGPEAIRQQTGGDVLFPTLSDVFAGMLLTERDPVEQLHKGVELLRDVLATGQNPWGTISGFDSYALAKAGNNRRVAEAVEQAEWQTTASGLKLAHLETDFFGAPGALYGVGAKVVVAYSPHFGSARVPKFTVAGNGVRVDAVLAELNARESGWGGPPTGTIIGSPRDGSTLTLSVVVDIVRKGL
ncbi:hypothetical protein HQ544_05515 [Candidatus Falkowbacteria bacterium]|nr:hypothetical protein [Candidatus Falkowbacteria bacterium]